MVKSAASSAQTVLHVHAALVLGADSNSNQSFLKKKKGGGIYMLDTFISLQLLALEKKPSISFFDS